MKLANYSQRYMTTSPLTLYLRQQQEQLLVKHCSSITYMYRPFSESGPGKEFAKSSPEQVLHANTPQSN